MKVLMYSVRTYYEYNWDEGADERELDRRKRGLGSSAAHWKKYEKWWERHAVNKA